MNRIHPAMPNLPELTRRLAEGTRGQKSRSWESLVLDAGLWSSCEAVLEEAGAASALGRAYRDLTGRWDRSPLHGGNPGAAAQVEAQLGILQRTVAAAALAAAARGTYDPHALLVWAARAAGDHQPLPGLRPDALPPGSARCRLRTAFRLLRADPQRQQGGSEAQRALAAAQDAALTFLARLPGEEPLAEGERLRIPLLLTRGDAGFVAWLWLERRDPGFGQVFQAPDSLLAPLLPDLRDAIQEACLLARAEFPCEDDVRWWIGSLPTGPDGRRLPVGGASAAAAAAVGLSHLLRRQKIQARCVITATLTPDGRLGPVEGLSGAAPKLKAARSLAGEREPVTVIVGPESRPPESEVAGWQEQGVRIVTAYNLGDAERLSTAPGDTGGRIPPGSTRKPAVRIPLLSDRDTPLARRLGEQLQHALAPHGFALEADRGETSGVVWARQTAHRIGTGEQVLILLTADAENSETLRYEIQLAHEAFQKTGRPRPILLTAGRAALPPFLTASGYPAVALPLPDDPTRDSEDGACPPALLDLLRGAPHDVPPGDAALPPSLPGEPAGGSRVSPSGVLPLDSEFYLERAADRDFRAALVRGDSIIRIKGARQMGKTSLLARGLHHARTTGATVILTDFQLLNQAHLESVDVFLLTLARHIARLAPVKINVEAQWDSLLGASVNFRDFLLELLAQVPGPVVWGLDEVDRLFACPFRAEVFGLLRSLHNERALNPSLPWSRLSLILCYATEAQLFLSDVNQSPFNVGTRIPLDDFTPEEVAELNLRYEVPLRSPAERSLYYDLLAGHPYLTHRGLHALADSGLTLAELQRRAVREDGLFGDHLRRLLLLLAASPELSQAVAEVVRNRVCPSAESFYRLWSAGVVVGESAREARPRCRLYAEYLERHLP